MKVTINNEEITLKYTIRAIFIFEKLADRIFTISNITDLYLYLYSLILASNPDTSITFNDLIDYSDSNPNLISDFKEWLDSENKKQNQFNKSDSNSGSKKKSSE